MREMKTLQEDNPSQKKAVGLLEQEISLLKLLLK